MDSRSPDIHRGDGAPPRLRCVVWRLTIPAASGGGRLGVLEYKWKKHSARLPVVHAFNQKPIVG